MQLDFMVIFIKSERKKGGALCTFLKQADINQYFRQRLSGASNVLIKLIPGIVQGT
jgi:hypothetical protein